MAVTATLAITNQWNDGQRLHVVGTVVLAGTYVALGDAVVWQNAADARPGFIGLQTTQNPDFAIIVGIAGFVYVWTPSTQKLQIRTGAAAQAALTDLTPGALPGGVTGDTITFYGIFKKP